MDPYRTAARMPQERVWVPKVDDTVRIGVTRRGTHGSPHVGRFGIIEQITYEKGKETVYGVFLGRSFYAFFFLDELERIYEQHVPESVT